MKKGLVEVLGGLSHLALSGVAGGLAAMWALVSLGEFSQGLSNFVTVKITKK